MKKILLIITSALICFIANSQNSLQGNWSNPHTAMGMTINETLSFSADVSGIVEKAVSVNLAASMMGAKISGEMQASMKGTFEYKDARLVIKWDKDSYQYKTVRPIEYSIKGKTDSQTTEELEKAMNAILDDLKNTAAKNDIYDSVTFKKGKLSLSGRDQAGKKHSETYTFLSE